MVLLHILFVPGFVLLAHGRQIIATEDDLMDTCERSCDEIGERYDKLGCKKVSKCVHNRDGWTRFLVRCDFCLCECEEIIDKPFVVVQSPMTTDEDALYDSCTGECTKSGLVRTNFAGYQEVRDCVYEAPGWIRGFVRCNICKCTGVNRKFVNKYTLKDMTYDFGAVEVTLLEPGSEPFVLGRTVLKNCGKEAQTVMRVISFSTSLSSSVETSKKLEAGVTLTIGKSVTAGSGVQIGVSRSLAFQLTSGFTTTTGHTATNTTMDQVRAALFVKGGVQQKAYVVGRRSKVNLPYKATLETVYDDGSTKEEQVSGTYNGLDFASWEVIYEAGTPAAHCGDEEGNNLASNPLQADGALFGPGYKQYDDMVIRQSLEDVKEICHPKCLQEVKCAGFSYRINARYDGRTTGNCWFFEPPLKFRQDPAQPEGLDGGGIWIKKLV